VLKKYKEIQKKKKLKEPGRTWNFLRVSSRRFEQLVGKMLTGWLAIKITFDVTSHSRKYAETPGSTEWLGECRESTRLNVQQGMSYKMT